MSGGNAMRSVHCMNYCHVHLHIISKDKWYVNIFGSKAMLVRSSLILTKWRGFIVWWAWMWSANFMKLRPSSTLIFIGPWKVNGDGFWHCTVHHQMSDIWELFINFIGNKFGPVFFYLLCRAQILLCSILFSIFIYSAIWFPYWCHYLLYDKKISCLKFLNKSCNKETYSVYFI